MGSKRRTALVAVGVLVAGLAAAGALQPDTGGSARSDANPLPPAAATDDLLDLWLADPEGAEGPAIVPDPQDGDGTATLRVWAQPDLPAGFEEQVAALPDVVEVVTLRRGLVHLAGSWDADGAPTDDLPAGYVVPMQAFAFDPVQHAALVDRHADLGSLAPGEVALSAAAAGLRQAGPGSVLDLEGHRVTVATVVPDEIAGSSEVLLTLPDAARFASFNRRSVTVRYEGPDDDIADAIAALVPPSVTARIRTPRDTASGPLVRGQVAIKQRFGEFAHGPVQAGGRFRQDPAWVDANIATARVPILGGITCHRDFIPLVASALGELEEAGLTHLVDPRDYAGCWAPRRVAGGGSISKHAWGVAIDINVSTNAYGATPTLDPRVVEAFERWGMRWGGDFLTPDGMHFEWFEDPEVAAEPAEPAEP